MEHESFDNKKSPSLVILDKIRVEARLWMIMGDKSCVYYVGRVDFCLSNFYILIKSFLINRM
jgi:hypothetical protein